MKSKVSQPTVSVFCPSVFNAILTVYMLLVAVETVIFICEGKKRRSLEIFFLELCPKNQGGSGVFFSLIFRTKYKEEFRIVFHINVSTMIEICA